MCVYERVRVYTCVRERASVRAYLLLWCFTYQVACVCACVRACARALQLGLKGPLAARQRATRPRLITARGPGRELGGLPC